MKRTIYKGKALPILLGAALLGTAGIGNADATAQSPAAPRTTISERTAFDGDAGFEKNAAGQTYGVPIEVKDQVAEPDLIRAEATNGKVGYIKNQERKVATTGDPSLFKSPEEVLKWQASRGAGPVTVPVYEVDGLTKIGEFAFSTGPVTGNVK